MTKLIASLNNMFERFADLKVVTYTAPIAQIGFFIAALRQFIPTPRSNCDDPGFNLEEILLPTVYFLLFKTADCLVKRSAKVSDVIQIAIYVVTYYFFRQNLR